MPDTMNSNVYFSLRNKKEGSKSELITFIVFMQCLVFKKAVINFRTKCYESSGMKRNI